ncbi:MAG TPA: VanZ family protein [Thermoanaerobaculia bacterium]|jgi:VanZ family protein|nr:VanZ family protein [Thermoanaerobaculia bacterium]
MRLLSSWLPVVLWAAIILSAANDRFSDKQTEGWLERHFGRLPPEVNTLMRKGAHVGEYAILSLLAWRARRTLATPLLVCLLVASADETLQAMTPTRTGTPKDVMLDMCGAVGALIVVPAARGRLVSRPRAE